MIECFEQQLAELAGPPTAAVEKNAEASILPPAAPVEMGPIADVLVDVGVADADDPLTAIMKSKVVERAKTSEAEYEAWKQSVLTIPAELRAVCESFNAEEAYDRAGYRLRWQTYDVLTLEKYIDIARGRSVSKTWFVGMEIIGPNARERVLLFFNHAGMSLRQDMGASRVSLAISRFDGARYNRLSSEPIHLREIGYRQGVLLSVFRDKKVEEGNARRILLSLLADIVKSYL